jgi:hypothetical protein
MMMSNFQGEVRKSIAAFTLFIRSITLKEVLRTLQVEKLTERNEGPTQKPAQLLNHLSEHPQKQMSVSWQSTVET